MDEARAEKRRLWQALGLFATIALAMAADLLADASEGARLEHVGGELGAMALALAGLGLLASRLRTLRRRAHALHLETQSLRADATELASALEAKREEALRYRDEARTLLEGLSGVIDRQFERWELSRAEREVGLLLLKGLSHQEVATARGTSDRTVRQQARTIYRKGGLSGRAELSAYFLEDLLVVG